jgi:predicted secreted protein
MSEAIAAVGTVFKRGNSFSSETFSAISEINSISGITASAEEIDVTSLDSTGGWREFIRGFRNAGTITLNMNWTRDNYITMLGDFESDDSINYQLVLPDTGETTIDFAGYVTELPMEIPTGDKVTMNVTIKVTGQPLVSS